MAGGGAGRARPSRRPSLQAKALAWLAQREHSRQELGEKLLRWARQEAARAAAAQPQDADPGLDPPRDLGADPDEGSDPQVLASRVEQTLDALEAAGHLSDQRFAESRVHARAARFGNRRIEQELRSKGTALDEPQRDALRASELERARAVWTARFGQVPADARERARQQRFLAGRGFSADTITRLLRDPDEGL